MQKKILILLLQLPFYLFGQSDLKPQQLEAIHLLNQMDTSISSAYWPHVQPGEFYQNVKKNILNPERIYQGHVTNFCGYAALSVILCREQPQTYVRLITDLYTRGETNFNSKVYKPSLTVLKTAGDLKGKGKLIINPADQLWLLALPDYFKGYMNLDKKYKLGDENKIWAACTLGKFNDMSRIIGDYSISSHGTDLVRPGGKSNYTFIRNELNKGIVVLYVNSKYLHPSKFRLFVLKAPTHFIIAYDISEKNGVIELKYWDYGLKTVELMTPKRLKKMTYGIIRLNTNPN
ncbi:MAG: hypothetical protein ACRC2O_08740 [Chitinophagaceae bacterium]